MNNDKQEIYKQFAFQIVRYIFVTFGTWLVRKGVIDGATADGITSADVIYSVLGLITIFVPVFLGWMKARFNVKFARYLHESDPSVPMSVVKQDVLTTESKVLSV